MHDTWVLVCPIRGPHVAHTIRSVEGMLYCKGWVKPTHDCGPYVEMPPPTGEPLGPPEERLFMTMDLGGEVNKEEAEAKIRATFVEVASGGPDELAALVDKVDRVTSRVEPRGLMNRIVDKYTDDPSFPGPDEALRIADAIQRTRIAIPGTVATPMLQAEIAAVALAREVRRLRQGNGRS